MEPLDASDPPRVASHRLLARLGAGGMGRVYLARSPAGRLVALKVMLPELAHQPEFRDRFQREVAAARAVRGPYVAEVVDADPDGDPPWLATGYVPGLSLADAVRRFGPLPSRTVAALAAGTAIALLGVQRAGLVHQDLKPSNVVLGGDGPWLIDFGVARSPDTGALDRQVMVGTPAYMAPEQIDGAPVGTAADVFSFGGVLTYALTGVGPFGHGAPHVVLDRVLHQAPDLSRVPQEWQEFLRRCLAKRPADRPTLPALLMTLVPAEHPVGELFGNGWLPDPLATHIRELTLAERRHVVTALDGRRFPGARARTRRNASRSGPTRPRRPRAWPAVAALAALGALAVPTALAQVIPPDAGAAPGAAPLTIARPSGTLPPAFTGSWSGTLHASRRHRGYPVRVTLRGGSVGSVVGTVDYWTVPCQGELRLQEVADGVVRVLEEFTQGVKECGSGTPVELAVGADGSLGYLGHYDDGGPRVGGRLRADPTGAERGGVTLGDTATDDQRDNLTAGEASTEASGDTTGDGTG